MVLGSYYLAFISITNLAPFLEAAAVILVPLREFCAEPWLRNAFIWVSVYKPDAAVVINLGNKSYMTVWVVIDCSRGEILFADFYWIMV